MVRWFAYFITRKSNYIYSVSNTNLNLLKYLERRLKQLGFFKFKIVTIKKEGFYFFNKKATDKMIHRKTSYRLEMNGYALLDFYNLIKDKLIINRKKEKVLTTIEHFTDYRGTSYNNYMRDKLAL
jgi:intein-encoded DNA endonuclease-like protein